MHIHFIGHTAAPVQKVSESELRGIMPDEDRGCFEYTWDANLEDDILTVAFTATIYINQALSNNEASGVEAHERRHFEDFRRLARELKESIESAIEKGNDPEIQTRLEWFDFDNCVARQRRHSEEGITDNLHCIQPFSSKPT
jgi:hypothetical protein